MGETINIKEYIDIFIRRKWIVIITILLCLIAGGYKTYKNYCAYTPTYRSNVTVRINTMKSVKNDNQNNSSTTGLTEEQQELQEFFNMYSSSASYSNQNIATSYVGLATNRNVYQNIAALTGISRSKIGFISAVQSEEIPQFIDMSVVSSTPQTAKLVASALPEAYNNELIRIVGIDCVEVVYEASDAVLIPRATDRTMLKALLAGIVVAVFLVLLVECLDTKVKTPEDVAKYWGVDVIGIIPLDDGKVKSKHSAEK